MNIPSSISRRKPGEQLLWALNSLLRTARIYQDNNKLISACLENFMNAAREHLEEGDSFRVCLSGGSFFLDDEKIPYRQETVHIMYSLLNYLEKRKIHGVRFFSSVLDADSRDLLKFARIMNDSADEADPFMWIREQAAESGLSWVEPLRESTQADHVVYEKHAAPRREFGRKIYSNTLASVKEVIQKISHARSAGLGRSLRTVQSLVDLLHEDEPLLMALGTIRVYDDYTCTHSVNVAMLSMCMGNRIGLSRKSLERLGLCGLFHDLGKIDIPHDILNKRGRLNNYEKKQIEKHSLNSVRQIIKLKISSERKAKILLPPFEHHLKYDLTGYPQTERKKALSLFGRILAITDVFDAITSPRVYRPAALSQDRAIRFMLQRAGKDFDPILLKVFVGMVGVYPLGTVLELDSGEIGVVMDTPGGIDGSRPWVVELIPEGDGYRKGGIIDLSERDPETGTFLKNIVRSHNPSLFGIQPVEFIV